MVVMGGSAAVVEMQWYNKANVCSLLYFFFFFWGGEGGKHEEYRPTIPRNRDVILHLLS